MRTNTQLLSNNKQTPRSMICLTYPLKQNKTKLRKNNISELEEPTEPIEAKHTPSSSQTRACSATLLNTPLQVTGIHLSPIFKAKRLRVVH